MFPCPSRLWHLTCTTLLLLVPSTSAAWPNTPFRTSGRWILDATGANVNYVGVNWPAHGEVMIPEGLQYQFIPAIVNHMKSLGMKAVRLTYAIEMVDQIYANNEADFTIGVALFGALGGTSGTKLLDDIVRNNPGFSSTTTRLQVFDAVVAECVRQEIFVQLDNHVSKAGWCCHPVEGNSWWGDTLFSTKNWIRGLTNMAEHASPPLTPSTEVFNPASFNDYADKLVLELHTYDPAQECAAFEKKLFNLGFRTLDSTSAKNTLPLVMTEFGFLQVNETYKDIYGTCLSNYLPAQRVGWMMWVVAGSYYVRELTHDYDETWGLLNHDWSG
ncbi:glycoside hydrolase superfamily [Immersiella caudata]|uniref:Glycoside hydrolase superfamily n=1 Tax=Immersiella caudata TaxID=314043 RepID=A0AA40BTY2_9PEZI|nr:glycoside hydrolase superfamily [Immersiella caudata]